MNRKIDIEYNEFPSIPIPKLTDQITNAYLNTLEIDIVKLAAIYNIEEFDDNITPLNYREYPALRYLIPNTDLFIFINGQPGKSKDSRRENSRVLGQTFCRYFNNEFLEAPYVANISDFIGKQLGVEFNSIEIKRKSPGDTPDFISAVNDHNIFLSEAKGRRKIIPFNNNDFKIWREQFDRISVLIGKNEISLKGYIFEIAIANEKNMISNSKILIEDPNTSGAKFEYSRILYNLIKCGHYKRILQILRLKFVGESLIYKDNLNEEKYRLPVYKSKISNKEYIGIFSKYHNHYQFSNDSKYYKISNGEYMFFFGIEKTVFKSLMEIARGRTDFLNKIEPFKLDKCFNESVIEFKDGTIFSDPKLISFNESEEF